MKVFLAYRATGEDQETLYGRLQVISDALHAAGVESYSMHLHQDPAPTGKTLKAAFEMINQCDALLVFVQSAEKSEGMSVEVGYAYGGRKPIHVLTKKGVHLTSFELADSITEYEDVDELTRLITNKFTQAVSNHDAQHGQG